MIVIVNQ